ncbi:hypothetical protein IN07_12020 [Modestobacter caceresii]|uniref:Uncharacterized protein n=1 Tax=Modestobacter caceresii TaxID=1522368 RepID=A0A098Y7L2_9ACTN|nr:hypothetical protein IN07_12020 [Modestobacter caceresii]
MRALDGNLGPDSQWNLNTQRSTGQHIARFDWLFIRGRTHISKHQLRVLDVSHHRSQECGRYRWCPMLGAVCMFSQYAKRMGLSVMLLIRLQFSHPLHKWRPLLQWG